MVDGKGKEEDLLVDEVFKYLNVGSIASDQKLCSLCLVGENRIAKDVDLTALLRYHTPPCNRNHASCDLSAW